jgi:hypothetical protein
MIKELPILFQPEMVRAIIAGRKTMTRRTRGIPESVQKFPNEWHYRKFGGMAIGPHTDWKHQFFNDEGRIFDDVKCPYGKPGDILWVRETCHAHEQKDGLDGVVYNADDTFIPIENSKDAAEKWVDLKHYGRSNHRFTELNKKVPTIHAPKWTSRIWLEVTDVKVERLFNISEEDAKLEGVELIDYFLIPKDGILYSTFSYREAFKSLWLKINGEESWQKNRWVWVISFKVLSTTGKPS